MKKKIKCQNKKCGYEWETESELANVTCPSCQKKTPTKEATK